MRCVENLLALNVWAGERKGTTNDESARNVFLNWNTVRNLKSRSDQKLYMKKAETRLRLPTTKKDVI